MGGGGVGGFGGQGGVGAQGGGGFVPGLARGEPPQPLKRALSAADSLVWMHFVTEMIHRTGAVGV